MSLKQEIETWVTALAAYDNNEFTTSIKCFEQIADTSKILFNCGVVHATLGEHAKAVECYERATRMDKFLAVAYFQQGVSNFLMGDFEEALANFNDALLYLRGHNNIDYEQLGLKFKLYSCEVLFNRGLCYIYLQQKEPGMQDLMYATREKVVANHDVIDEAIREQAEGYTVFSIPVGVVYRPNEAKVKNLKTKDYLGKARLVASQDFQAGDPRRQAAMAAMSRDDIAQEKLSYAALNLVRPDLRSRQQSEPPLRRNIFPPTPPPELERPDSAHGMRKSAESAVSERSNLQQARPAAKALRLELGAAAFDQRYQQPEKPRLATKRSESERPLLRREFSGGSNRSYENPGRRAEQPVQRASAPTDVPEVRVDPIKTYSEQASQPQQQPSRPPMPPHRRSRSSAPRAQPGPIEDIAEEDDYDGESMTSPSESAIVPLAFEIVPPPLRTQPQHQPRARSTSRRRAAATTGTIPISPPQPPRFELRKIRVKVHAEDMRYVMATPATTYDELVGLVRTKLGMPAAAAVAGGASAFKLKIRDEEGDMVVMGDDDDWEMAVANVRVAARKENNEMGKLEVWVQET